MHKKQKKSQNMIYVKLQRVNLPVTVTNERRNVAKEFVDDELNSTKKEIFLD